MLGIRSLRSRGSLPPTVVSFPGEMGTCLGLVVFEGWRWEGTPFSRTGFNHLLSQPLCPLFPGPGRRASRFSGWTTRTRSASFPAWPQVTWPHGGRGPFRDSPRRDGASVSLGGGPPMSKCRWAGGACVPSPPSRSPGSGAGAGPGSSRPCLFAFVPAVRGFGFTGQALGISTC